jgi:hypothetical protein
MMYNVMLHNVMLHRIAPECFIAAHPTVVEIRER